MTFASCSLPQAISFSGCGFLGVYHVGVITCLQKHGANLLSRMEKYAGASGGGLAAAVLALCPDNLSTSKKMVYDLASRVRSLPFGALSRGFCLSDEVRKLANEVLPKNAHELATDRLYLSLTRAHDKKNVIISSYSSRDDLIQCLVCTCHIPVFSGRKLPVYDGQTYYDGGFTNNLINFESDGLKTLLVTPFSGSEEYICPTDSKRRWNVSRVNQKFCVSLNNFARFKQAMFPPKNKRLDRHLNQGYLDALGHLAVLHYDHPDLVKIGPEPVSADQMATLRAKKLRLKENNRQNNI